jgi:membrane protein implicated in regulation of membrane protease activity
VSSQGNPDREAWTFARYLLWQVPGWLLAAAAGVLITRLAGLPAWVAVLVLVLLIVKDLALFPALRVAFGRASHSPWPIGERGRTVEPLEPSGYVRVNGELWRAEACPPAARIAARQAIVVRGARGLTLLVEEVDLPPAVSSGPRTSRSD